RRVRISTQSQKRPNRKSANYQQHHGETSMRTIHQAHLRNVVHARLADKNAAGANDNALS
ncbi:type I-E CRISPR-associated protein Cas7/Cse4/CasC, partial [Erwinia amylovora]|nr:type I-E CRISPR-associated protein Cas7/Cse4/CasC [Erwinia amylovora]